MTPDLLTAQEAAKLLRCHRNTAYQLAADREIEYVRVGKRVLFPRSAVEKFIARHTVAERRQFLARPKSMKRVGARHDKDVRRIAGPDPERLAAEEDDQAHRFSTSVPPTYGDRS